MCDDIRALLKRKGFDSLEAVENDVSQLQQKLCDAVAKKRKKLVDGFTDKLAKRRRLQNEVADLKCGLVLEMLNSWGCTSLDDLEHLILGIKGRIANYECQGSFDMVAEEECELAELLQTQSDIQNVQDMGNVDSIGRSEALKGGVSSIFDEIVSNSKEGERNSTSLPPEDPSPDLIEADITTGSAPPHPEIRDHAQISEVSQISPSSIEQHHRDPHVWSRLENVPECSEKSLSLLHEFFKSEHRRLQSNDFLLDAKVPVIKPVDYLIELFRKLMDQLMTEKLESLAKKDFQEFKELFDHYVTNRTGLAADLRDLLDSIERVLLRIILATSPLDVALLLDSVRGSIVASHLIKGKDIILLLGSTGVGKSTLMHFLAGSRMRVTTVGGIPHVEPEKVMSGLEDVKYSCSSRSETTGIHAVTMNVNGETYSVCDTAGFDDTRGVEYDIASGIVMTNAIRSASSVKLVLVIDQGTIAMRFSNLRKSLIPAIIKLIPSFKNYVKSIFYLFNMVSDPIGSIAARLKDISTNLAPAERADVDFAAMITDLAKKSITRVHATVADIIDGNHQELLRDLNAVDPILHPENIFCHFAAPTSISILNKQLNLHKAAISRGLDSFEVSGSRADLLLVDYKLRQLLDLHLLVGLQECESLYVDCVETTFRFVQKMHCRTFQRLQNWFEDVRVYETDTEISACIQQVYLLFELESIRNPHVGRIVESEEGLGNINVREIILSLILRLQISCQENVNMYFNNVFSTSDADVPSYMSTVAAITKGSLAASQLTKMKNITSVLRQELEISQHSAAVAAEATQIAFAEVIQVYFVLVTEINKSVISLKDAVQVSIDSKSYSTGLPSLQRLKAFEVFDSSHEIGAYEAVLQLQTLFVGSIICDCDKAKDAIDENTSDSVDNFNKTLQQVLDVSALTIFNELVDMGGVRVAQKSLIAHVGLTCDRITTEFNVMITDHDIEIFIKIKVKAAIIDQLRSHQLVMQQTADQHHTLIDAIKTSLEYFSKSAVKQISNVTTVHSNDVTAPTDSMPPKNVISLKDLLIMVNDASTFQGGLKSAYKGEFDIIMSEVYRIMKVLSDHVTKGENGVKVSFKSQSTLKSLFWKRSRVCNLSDIVNDCVGLVPALKPVPGLLKNSLSKCDIAVARAATEGVAHIRNLVAITASAMVEKASDVAFKDNVRDALLFFSSAESLGFPSFLTDDQKAEVLKASCYFEALKGSILLPLKSTEGYSDCIPLDIVPNEVTEESVRGLRDAFFFLKSFQSLFIRDDGWYILQVKESIDGVLKCLTESVFKFLIDLDTTAKRYKSSSNSSPTILDELHKEFQICGLLSSIDNYLPVDCTLKFVTVGHKFKSLLSDISNSIRNKILTHDYDGILDDLRKFDRNNPAIIEEMKQILQLVFKALHDQERKIADSVLLYRLDTSSAAANQSLIHDLRKVSVNSMQFMLFVSKGQMKVILTEIEIITCINRSRFSLCTACKSGLENTQPSSTKCNFVETEEIIRSADSMFQLLETLAKDINDARIAQEPLITQLEVEWAPSIDIMLDTNSDSDAREALHIAIQSSRQTIDEVLSSIGNFCGKQVNLEEIKAMQPSRIFDELKRAEQYDNQDNSKYKQTATKLRNLLISSVKKILEKASHFLEHDDREFNDNVSSTDSRGESSYHFRSQEKGTQSASLWGTDDISTLEDCENFVKQVEMLTPYLPSDLFGEYQSRLEEIKSMVDSSKKAHLSRINAATSSDANRCHELANLFNYYRRRRDFYRMKDTGDAMNRKLRSVTEKVTIDLQSGKLWFVLSALSASFLHWKKYIDDISLWRSSPAKYSNYLVHTERTWYVFQSEVKLEVDNPIRLFRELEEEVLRAVHAAIQFIMNRDHSLADMEPHLDGLILMLSDDAGEMLSSISHQDKSVRDQIGCAIVAVGKSFAQLGQKASDLLGKVNTIFDHSTDPTFVIDDAKCHLLKASEQIALTRRCVSLFDKVCAQCDSSSVLHSKYRLKLKRMNLSSVSFAALSGLINKTVENLLQIAKSSLHGNKILITPNASDRNSFYRRMQFALVLLIYWDSYQAIVQGCANKNFHEESVKDKLMVEIESIGVAADRLVESTDSTQLGILYDNLRSINDNFINNDIKDRAMSRMKTIDSLFFERIKRMKERGWLSEEEWHSSTFGNNQYGKIAKELISMKLVTTQIAHYKKRIDTEFIDQLLKDYKSRNSGAAGAFFFLDLSNHLSAIRTSDAPIAAQILGDHAAFYGHKLHLRNEKVLRFTVEDVLSTITGDNEDGIIDQALDEGTKDRLLKISNLFEEDYWARVGTGLECGKDLETELAALITMTKDVARRSDLPQKQKIRMLMACIFAYWTLDGSKHYQETISSQGNTLSADGQGPSLKKCRSLLQPHAGQIVGILRIFGLGEDEDLKLSPGTPTVGNFPCTDASKKDVPNVRFPKCAPVNHVVQIGTGEGKSVTLAVSAMLLSLLGFDADVVCYSEYLSDRDYKSFEKLFTKFGLTKSIRYGTFKTICEKFLNGRGNIREGVSSIMSSKSGTNSFAASNDIIPRVLLIDEVDVFFNKDFYANIYKPYAKLSSNEITAFVKELWKVHRGGVKGALAVVKIKKWPLYAACVKKYGGWEFFIEETLKMLLGDLKIFNGPGHTYHVDCERSRIGYKDHDGYVYNINHGYQTMFAYFKEYDSKTITSSGLNMNIYFLVDCGDFSYAAVPKLYASVLGASGTLKELSEGERNVLRNVYDVKRATYLPSVYGSNKMKFDANSNRSITITSAVGYYKEIVNEIELRLRGNPKERAVLVFFETKKKVNDFLESPAMSARRGQVRVMREEDTVADREQAVRQAVASKSITLLSRDFGRGTDFVCYDEDLNVSGGIHVIQTFVSLEVSEETQIKGRTARQGNFGSYSLILLDSELESIQITADMIVEFEAKSERYTVIDRMRKETFNSSYSNAMMYVDTIKQTHEESQEFLQALYRSDITSVKEFIKKRNNSGSILGDGVRSRTICLMDATGSMSGVLDRAKMTVQTMFERAHAVLEDEGYTDAFEMQFAVYRNYNAGSMILEHSTWERKPENLRKFMGGIKAAYGLGNEAIEIGLCHVNREIKAGTVSQVILIGDMPPNTREEVRAGRAAYSFRSDEYPEETYYEDELQHIIEAEVPVHAFYVNQYAMMAFKDIAARTTGSTGALDITSHKGADMLTSLVTLRILENVNKFAGGGAAGEKRLKESYHSRYGFV